MLGTILKFDDHNLWLLEDGKNDSILYNLAEWIKPEFVRLGKAEITIDATKKNLVTFVAMIDDMAKQNSKAKPQESSESFGEFNANEITNIKGKNYVIYEGLLRLAHKKGLKKFEIIEKFISADMKTAWVQVRAYCEKEGKETFFDGIGSSTPENTGTMTQDHPVEMAHTRAKGRALRDFLNIGQAMAEELKPEK